MAEISRKMVIEAERNKNHGIGKMVIKGTRKKKKSCQKGTPRVEGTDSLDSDLVRVSDKEEQPDSTTRDGGNKWQTERLAEQEKSEVERDGGWERRGFIRGADKRKSRRWRRQSMERFIDRKRKQEIRGVGDRQKHKEQAAKAQNIKQRLTRTDRQRLVGK